MNEENLLSKYKNEWKIVDLKFGKEQRQTQYLNNHNFVYTRHTRCVSNVGSQEQNDSWSLNLFTLNLFKVYLKCTRNSEGKCYKYPSDCNEDFRGEVGMLTYKLFILN